MLHQIICEQMTFEDYCMENKITKQQAMKNFRNELSLILKTKIKTQVPIKEEELTTLQFSKPPIK